jgi:RND family efflux transporter MFP subunit
MNENNGHPSPSSRLEITEPTERSKPAAPKRSLSWLDALFILLLLTGAVAIVFTRKAEAHEQLASATRQMDLPSVLVVHPEEAATDVRLDLPGKVEAYAQTSIYARVNGYLKNWLVDIGTPVKKGQLLAEIDTPETDQQLAQAQATVAQAQANLNLSQTTANRYNALLKAQAVSQQDADVANSDLAAKKADHDAAQANVNRLEQIEGFKEVYAPFDGIITARQVDIGNLINAGAGTPAQELFQIEQTDILRVYVSVPEVYSDLVLPGTTAQVELASTPGQNVQGVLARTSKAINPNSLSLLTEVDVPNANGQLFPGGYAQVHFNFPTKHPAILIPGNALIFRSDGPQVGIVDPHTNLVHLQSIKIGRDLGVRMEIVQGLEKDDLVIVNPSDSLSDGTKVRIQLQIASAK